jgi:hypothetical protein
VVVLKFWVINLNQGGFKNLDGLQAAESHPGWSHESFEIAAGEQSNHDFGWDGKGSEPGVRVLPA